MLNNLPVLNGMKSPIAAFFIGLFFGSIGIGIYFRSLLDFFVPVIVFIVCFFAGFGIGALPGWLFAGFWGMMRALNSNSRLGY